MSNNKYRIDFPKTVRLTSLNSKSNIQKNFLKSSKPIKTYLKRSHRRNNSNFKLYHVINRKNNYQINNTVYCKYSQNVGKAVTNSIKIKKKVNDRSQVDDITGKNFLTRFIRLLLDWSLLQIYKSDSYQHHSLCQPVDILWNLPVLKE